MSHSTLRSAAVGHGHIIQTVILFLAMSIILTLLTVNCGRPRGVVIDGRYSIPDDPREFYSRYVNFRPGNGETVKLNPPRFSWTYLPDVVPESLEIPGKQLFTLQISRTADFRNPVIEVKDVPFNFYNTLPELKGSKEWFWRVGYNAGTTEEKWSDVRSFTLDPGAVVWDRSSLADPDIVGMGHPRILFNRDNLEAIRALRNTDSLCAELAEQVRDRADEALRSTWWSHFPSSDRISPEVTGHAYHDMSEDLIWVAFAYILFQDEKYQGFKERFLTIASWPIGGWSSPEGATYTDVHEFKGGRLERSAMGAKEEATKTTEFLAIFFDWFYHDLNNAEREKIIGSIEWRISYSYNSFFWKRENGKYMSPNCLAMIARSHDHEGFYDNMPAVLAIYEHSEIARKIFKMGINYFIGVTNGFGQEQAWNEGTGYGNSKMKWLLNTTIIYDIAFKDGDFTKNPYYRTIGDFFIHLAPVGLQHSSFGNGALGIRRIHDNRILNFRRLAYLTGDAKYLENREESLKMFQGDAFRPWTEYVLPYYYEKPENDPATITPRYRLVKLDGWVMASSLHPSSFDNYQNSVGILFHCRPRGGYSHSFFNENAFDIHAFGQVLTHGGNSTDNTDLLADQTMSHNSILVDGKGQYQHNYFPMTLKADGTIGRLSQTRAGYIPAFHASDEYIYWIGDATNAYFEKAPYLEKFRRHILFVKNKYFIIFDELRTDRSHEPSTFQWLYHVLPDVTIDFDPENLEFGYQIGESCIKVRHIAGTSDLAFEDRRRLDGMVNPLTGEDFTKYANPDRMFEHNIWISSKKPSHEFTFMTVLAPYKKGDTEPRIQKLDDWTASVEYGSDREIITFDVHSKHKPDITVDFRSFK